MASMSQLMKALSDSKTTLVFFIISMRAVFKFEWAFINKLIYVLKNVFVVNKTIFNGLHYNAPKAFF